MTAKNLKRIAMGSAVALVIGTFAESAAALVASAGGQEIRIDTRSETAATVSSSLLFVDVGAANVIVFVPGGTTRHFTARFAAESQCFGAAAAPAAWCSVQIVATNLGTGATTLLNPASGVDYAFDTNPAGGVDDQWEGNAIERSIRLQPGQYRIRVQRRVTNNQTIFRLDDWHLTVETNL